MAKAQVRGTSAYSREPSAGVESAAFLTDLGATCALFFGSIRLFSISPVPRWSWIPILTLLFLMLWIAQKWAFHRTLGERVWNLRPFAVDAEKNKYALFQASAITPKALSIGIFLTVTFWSAAFLIAQSSYKKDPRWLHAGSWQLAPFLPDLAAQNAPIKWFAAPYFYSLGTWPKTYNGNPVFYSVPYEKGPPQRFIGRIIAKWDNPGTSLTFEGPKTPNPDISRTQIRRCIGPSWSSPLLDWGCMKVREKVLSRHIAEMERFHPSTWKLKWFVVNNPALPPEEVAQGFYIEAANEKYTQARYIVVTRNGTNQAFILKTNTSAETEGFLKLLEHAVGSLRVSDDLNPGRAWIDKQLQSIKLDKILKEKATTEWVERLASVQAILISKLSVDPKAFETYYHLAGTSLILLQRAAESKNLDWALTAKPLIQSAYLFAQDVAPKHKDMPRLQNLWLETKKF